MRRFTRRSRHRRIGWITVGSLLVVLVLLVVAAVFSPMLALKQIRVDGAQRIDAAELQTALDDQLGTPLALIDHTRIRDDLSEFTLIRSYVTEIVPPDTLLVHIVERSTIGVVQQAGGYDLVDPAGVVIDTVPERPAGVPLLQLAAGDDVGSPGFSGMAQVLLALPPAVLAQVDTVTARTRDDVTFTLVGGQRVVWGSAQSSTCKAENLAALLLIHAGAGPGAYDVSACGVPVWSAG